MRRDDTTAYPGMPVGSKKDVKSECAQASTACKILNMRFTKMQRFDCVT